MASKIDFKPVVDANATGRAKVASEAQERRVNGNSIDYTVGYAYYVPTQWVHEVPSGTAGFNPSQRVFAIEYARSANGKLTATGAVTAIKKSAILQTYLDLVTEEPAPKFHCELNAAGLNRPVDSRSHYCVTGGRALKAKMDEGFYISRPVVFWADGIKSVYVPQFEQKEGGYDMLVDDENNLALDTMDVMFWHVEAASLLGISGNLSDFISKEECPLLDELEIKNA